MFQPGDVIHLYSVIAGKPKFHLCVSLNGCFLMLNSPKQRVYAGDVVVPCASFPFIDATESGNSIISCSVVVKFSDAELRSARAQFRGRAPIAILRMLVQEIERSEAISDEDREAALDGLGDWL